MITVTQKTDTLETWRLNLNTVSQNAGDPSQIYSSDGTDTFIHPTSNLTIAAINDLNSRKVKRSGDTITSLAITNGLSVGGTTSLAAATATTPAPVAGVGAGDTSIATTAWVIGQAANTIPGINGGVGSSGHDSQWSRADHVHPFDPTVATNNNPSFVGKVSFSTNPGLINVSDVQVVSTTTTSVTANQVLAAFSALTYRSVEFIIQAIDVTDVIYHSATIKAIHDGVNAYSTEYAAMTGPNGVAGIFSVDFNSNNLRLLVTPSHPHITSYKITAILTLL